MRSGANPLLLLRELKQLGSLRLQASMAAVPPLAELDPERCYISWDMVLTTVAARDAISDVFIFVDDSCELSIEPAPGIKLEPAVEPAPERVSSEAASPVATESNAPGKKDPPCGRRASDTPDNASSIRVPAAKLDQFVNLVGELVTVQARLVEVAARREDPEVVAVSEEIERLTSALRENSMSIRMLPIRATFERFRRLVHDLARDLHKEVELTIEGADTELDKTVIDQLNDPLMHLIRNSMDHGIEPPEARLAAGKRSARNHPSFGAALGRQRPDRCLRRWRRDQCGSRPGPRHRKRSGGRGRPAYRGRDLLLHLGARLFHGAAGDGCVRPGSGDGRGPPQAWRPCAEPSTSPASPAAGTSVTLRLPLTMAIIDGLLVRVGQAYFVLPLATTLECIELTRQDIEKANGKHVANVRGEIIPYIRLREYFNMPIRNGRSGNRSWLPRPKRGATASSSIRCSETTRR